MSGFETVPGASVQGTTTAVPVQPVAVAVTHDNIEYEGTTTFAPQLMQIYRYSLSLKSCTLRAWLENCDNKKQWSIVLVEYVDATNYIPNVGVLDYIESTKDDRLRLEFSVNIQAMLHPRVLTYVFNLEPISVERINVLEAKLRDLQDEVQHLRHGAGAGFVVVELQNSVVSKVAKLVVDSSAADGGVGERRRITQHIWWSAAADTYVNPEACSGVCVNTNDPSIIRRADGTYFRFSTGDGIAVYSAPKITASKTSSSMVRAIRPPRPTYMNSQVSGFYFRPCRNKNDEVILEYFRCRCGTCFRELLNRAVEDASELPRSLQSTEESHLQQEFSVKIQAMLRPRMLTYAFDLEPISVERVDILEAKLRDLQDEVKDLRSDAAVNTIVAELQDVVKKLQRDLSEREVADADLRNQVGSLQTELITASEELKNLRQHLSGREEVISRLQNDIEGLESAAERHETIRLEATSRIT
ncbi:hypothetical protein PHYSODRAFT_342811 [Phytophthora sojae]|uniref:Uncharacterized protein n=1 Tax=Phytophthora sojae (strain P6497) TaxID=1094619 RepID=G5AHP0_PHYSP|nr:hypothetical protein PHYSODRAFT_342811 [Phytophthora sojae]EGZ04961.1 hypothetical protein PHYSODRAFT_342811 [Phytophthora sojae]|eukprot:XP_009539591.1 hypothetical protein PHYSODRAFT_342811 [Phytophthora sojae]